MGSKNNRQKMKYCILIISVFILISCNENYVVKDHIIKGNTDYHKRDFENAITDYKKALFLDQTDTIANYNAGNSFYRIKDFAAAAEYYRTVDSLALTTRTKAEANHNKGNAYLKIEEFDKAVEAYKKALRNNPNDQETQYNFNVALEKIKQKEEKEEREQQRKQQEQKQQQNQQKQQNSSQQQQQKNQQQEKQQQQQSEDQSKKQQQNQGQNQQQQSKQESKSDDEQKKEEDTQQNPSTSTPQNSTQNQERGEKTELSISEEQVEAILRALENEEKAVQRRMLDKEKRQNSTQKKEKDW